MLNISPDVEALLRERAALLEVDPDEYADWGLKQWVTNEIEQNKRDQEVFESSGLAAKVAKSMQDRESRTTRPPVRHKD